MGLAAASAALLPLARAWRLRHRPCCCCLFVSISFRGGRPGGGEKTRRHPPVYSCRLHRLINNTGFKGASFTCSRLGSFSTARLSPLLTSSQAARRPLRSWPFASFLAWPVSPLLPPPAAASPPTTLGGRHSPLATQCRRVRIEGAPIYAERGGGERTMSMVETSKRSRASWAIVESASEERF